jgi:hypothetical protein
MREQPGLPDARPPKRPVPGPTPAVLTILYVVGTLVFVFVLSMLTTGVTARSVSYTEFKQLVRSGKVEDVVISQERIRGTLKESKEPFSTVRVEDPGLLGELEQRGLAVKGEVASN